MTPKAILPLTQAVGEPPQIAFPRTIPVHVGMEEAERLAGRVPIGVEPLQDRVDPVRAKPTAAPDRLDIAGLDGGKDLLDGGDAFGSLAGDVSNRVAAGVPAGVSASEEQRFVHRYVPEIAAQVADPGGDLVQRPSVIALDIVAAAVESRQDERLQGQRDPPPAQV